VALSEIQALIAKSQWDDALERTLAEWRATKAPAYANLLEALSAKCRRAPLAQYVFGEFRWSWSSRVRSTYAADADPLMDAFGIELAPYESRAAFEVSPAAARVRRALEQENTSIPPNVVGPFMSLASRIETLAERHPDPRVARGLVRFLTLAPVAAEGAMTIATYGPIYELVGEFGDVRMIPKLEALPFSGMRERALAALNRTNARKLDDEKAVQSLAIDLGYHEPPAPLDVHELFELVLEDLNDDTPRAILGDRWIEANDPRGEFVSLQLKNARGECSTADLERMATLEKLVEGEWLGEVILTAREKRFCRGFLEEITLAAEGAMPSPRWEAVAKNPLLGTVRMLRPGRATDTRFLRFMNELRNVEEVEITNANQLSGVLKGKRPKSLRRIELHLPRAPGRPSTQVGECIDAGFERVTVVYDDATHIREDASLLNKTTEAASVVLKGMDACLIATRSASGLALDITSRDSGTVGLMLEGCKPTSLILRRPKGASIYGANGDSRRLAERIRAMGMAAKPDASWQKRLAE
jgi:hypothetical protein